MCVSESGEGGRKKEICPNAFLNSYLCDTAHQFGDIGSARGMAVDVNRRRHRVMLGEMKEKEEENFLRYSTNTKPTKKTVTVF